MVSEFALGPGVVLAGKYRVERLIGQGGMGVVLAVQHIQLEQRMALKLMLPHVMGSTDAIARFLREARAAARISSDHVARVFDVGAVETGEPYIAMEYLEGSDIAQLLAARGRLSVEESIDYLLQAGEALAEAHQAGIVHRDLKPGNLFLVRRVDGQQLVKVLDFGISKVSGSAASGNVPATHTSALMGSPLYMSPEQMGSAKHVDARSDVWALGVVLYEMLSGTAPFNGETLPQVCAMVMTEPPHSLEERVPGLPSLLYQVVQRCLEKRPEARFQNIAELAHALAPLASLRALQSVERIARVQGVSRGDQPAQLLRITPSAASAPPIGTYAPWGETRPPGPSRRGGALLAAAAVVAVGVLGVGAWLALRAPSVNESALQLASDVGSAPALVAAAAPAASEVVEPLAAPPVAPAPTQAEIAVAPSVKAATGHSIRPLSRSSPKATASVVAFDPPPATAIAAAPPIQNPSAPLASSQPPASARSRF